MLNAKDEEVSKVFTVSGVENMLRNRKENISQMPVEVVDNVKEPTREKCTNEEERRMVVHTEAAVNWATIANKITVPNIAKSVLTIGTGSVGSLLGAGVFTGLGFVMGGPAGATMGYKMGNVVGFGAGTVVGAVGGKKVGKIIEYAFDDTNREGIVNRGTTKITADRKIDVKRG
jgi:hypothetical protein